MSHTIKNSQVDLSQSDNNHNRLVGKAKNTVHSALTATAGMLVWSLLGSATALAQDAEPVAATPSGYALEEVIVSARKRDESILDVPLSVQAFSAIDLQQAGMVELESLAGLTPNLDFQNVGNSQPGRYNSAIRFRGMDTSITTPTNQSGAFFVDGVNVLGGASSVSFSDIARVEVIKGPQPVYFGRGTFGGAINYTTVDPSEEFGGYIAASYSPTFGSNDFTSYIEGELAEGLTGRLTAFSRTQGATFTATDGGDLGEENTSGISTILSFQPSDELRIKARVAYSEDDDGASSSTFVRYADVGNIEVGTPITVNTSAGMFDTSFNRIFYSGDLPNGLVSNNTSFYTVRAGQADEVNVGEAFDLIEYDTETPDLDHFGVRTDMLIASLAADFDVNESLTLSTLVGYSNRDTTQVRDGDLYDSPAWALTTALSLTSWSAEFRAAYDNGGPIRLLGGVNYASAEQFGDIDGGYAVFDGLFGTLQVGPGFSSLEVADITTLGVFGSLEYDVLDWVTLAAEARYQKDESDNQAGWYGSLVPSTSLEFSELLPRLSVSLSPFEGTNIYLSYAEGTLPGSVNNAFAGLSDAEREEAQAIFPDIKEELDSELLKTFELGWKQSALDGALWFSLVGFHQEWENMKGASTVAFTSPSTGNDYLISATLLGSSTQDGIEFETRWLATENLEFQASYGFTDSTYDEFAASSMNSILGLPPGTSFLADGNTLPRSPKHSGALSATWNDQLNDEWSYLIRGDYIYRGKSYADELNLTTIAAYSLINLRVGLENMDGLGMELYCSNCADKSGWATGRRLTDFGVLPANFFTFQGAVVDPITPREIGVRFNYSF